MTIAAESSPPFLLSFLITIVIFSWVALGQRKKHSAADFAVAGRCFGRWHVAGAIMGTLVGGASTIGTVQMAYLYGLSGWWFTLGAGIACLFLAATLAGPLRSGEVVTLAEFIARYHGERARVAASLFSSFGMFIHIIAQLLAGGTLLVSLFKIPQAVATFIAAGLIALVAVKGGLRRAGSVGLVKLLLLYVTMIGAGGLALNQAGGLQNLKISLPYFPWFSLFGYGMKECLSDMLSMIIGVVSTQIYLQAIFAAKNVHEARQGAMIGALLIPPLGLCGVAVGMAMRLTYPGINSAEALPTFLLHSFPPLWAGVAFATLLFAAIATAAGLAIGIGTTIQTDLLGHRADSEERRLKHLQMATLFTVLVALLLVMTQLDSLILHWSFLSMGIRGATLFVPLMAAVYFGRHTARKAGAVAIVMAPIVVILSGLSGWKPVPPLYLGLAVSVTVIIAGLCLERPPINKP
ncbi:MAG: sodium:solute symporter family protein [Deltaproteobacteria bacterium]|jgi:SSS family solute:Na+ symporter|nr:sodium:solute symporter family protein [Deltaproteobacteria bacterium]MBW2503698.1 sodium:solute symporter family protein [Deltaproteobacteria bacterium]MBW2520263.1 sodium:solute symporter family protein [Deltaproteobacteria bacterium]